MKYNKILRRLTALLLSLAFCLSLTGTVWAAESGVLSTGLTTQSTSTKSPTLTDINTASVDWTMDGDWKAANLKIEVHNGDTNAKLTEGVDYTADVETVSKSIFRVTLHGMGRYTGSKVVEVKDFVFVKVKEKVYREYSTSKQTFNLNAKCVEKLYYNSWDKKIKVDKNGKVTIPAKYAGIFNIYVGGKENKNYDVLGASVWVVVRPSKTSLSRISAGKKKMTVRWKRNKVGNGYELQYSTDKKFKKNVKTVKIKGNKTTSKTLKGLKKGTWYVRIRTVKTQDEGQAASKWSAAKKVKVKK